jgi:hypothetical protein
MTTYGARQVDLVRNGEDGGVERALVQPIHETVAVLDVLLDPDAAQDGVERREDELCKARDRAHTAYGVLPGGPRGLERTGEVAQDVIGLTSQLRPRGRRPRALGVSVEQLETGATLEPCKSLAR